jgi:CRISPR-associated endoribonuclease Cas6
MASQRGELFSFLLHLYPLEPEQSVLGVTASQVQAAFLDVVHQIDPTLSDWLRETDQHASYTVTLLPDRDYCASPVYGRNGLYRQRCSVRASQACWLNITILDAELFSSFVQYLIAKPYTLTIKIGESLPGVRPLSLKAKVGAAAQSLVAYSSFEDLYAVRLAQRQYRFDFISPTLLYSRRRPWERDVQTLPEPCDVFGCLARQWELFAPAHLRMNMHDLSVRAFSLWCDQNIAVTCYAPHAGNFYTGLPDQAGFQGTVVYEVRGRLTEPEARWLSPLARFAIFSGVGCKTAMGMGRVRCSNLVETSGSIVNEEVQ